VNSGWGHGERPALAICSPNKGTTEPEDPSTLPKGGTIEQTDPLRAGDPAAAALTAVHRRRLLAPFTLGRTAFVVKSG